MGVTGYEADFVNVTMLTSQVTIQIVNSKLLQQDHAARDAEAAKISAATARVVEAAGSAGSIQAIHIDYVTKDATAASKIVDAIDFRKNPDGKFLKDIT